MKPLLAAAVPSLLLLAVALLAAPAVPAGRPAQDASSSPWPQEGSHVEYALAASFAAPDGSYQRAASARLVLSYAGGAWSGTCHAEETETVDGITATASSATASGGGPALAPAGVRRGDALTLPLLGGADVAEACRQGPLAVEALGKERRAAGWDDARGRPVLRTAWVAAGPADGAPRDVDAAWDQRTGLVLGWSVAAPGGSWSGALAATDAF